MVGVKRRRGVCVCRGEGEWDGGVNWWAGWRADGGEGGAARLKGTTEKRTSQATAAHPHNLLMLLLLLLEGGEMHRDGSVFSRKKLVERLNRMQRREGGYS